MLSKFDTDRDMVEYFINNKVPSNLNKSFKFLQFLLKKRELKFKCNAFQSNFLNEKQANDTNKSRLQIKI